jgi:aspartate/methionine/tyrosine aminotransferase
MKINVFQMERWQSEWEHVVDFNLSESGVHPMSIKDLIPMDEIDRILNTRLGYIQTDGTSPLKERISEIYPGSGHDNILVTSGSAEANFLLMWRLMEKEDEVVFMLPNFLQMQGLAEAFAADVKPFYLKEELAWQPEIEQLNRIVNARTKAIILTNPNNPTGSILSPQVCEEIVAAAERAGAWLIVDEIYLGSELNGTLTPSFWGRYAKTIITSGLSKAYGLPGLRVGWIVAPSDLISSLWTYKDYTSITIAAVSDLLAQVALTPDIRAKILARTRDIINTNYAVLAEWIEEQQGLFSCIAPQAGAIAFPRYQLDINSTRMALELKNLKNVLICPGDQFGMDQHIRVGLGEPSARFRQGLDLISEGLQIVRQNLHSGNSGRI